MSTRRVTRIDELPQDVPPARDLWPGIAAAIAREIGADKVAMMEAVPARRRTWMPLAGMAAAVALVAFGVVIGLQLQATPSSAVANVAARQGADGSVLPAAWRDDEYRTQRAALMAEVQSRLQTMPPAEREKVAASLRTLQRSITDIEAALGRDPANALLQELLVDSCQEEMRALAAVRDSGSQES
jgi:hypothetical protein